MPIHTQCEHCGFAYISKDEMAGKKVRCRNCGQVFAIPAFSDAAPHPGEQSAADELAQLDELTGQPRSAPPPEPLPGNSDETGRMPAVTKIESNMTGGVGSAKSRMERTGDVEEFSVAGSEPGELTRPSVPFSFPYAGDLDTWLPRVLPLLTLALLFLDFWGWRPDPDNLASYPQWAPLIPIGLLLLVLLVIWLPIFSAAMHKVATAMNFALPPGRAIRAICLASLPLALGGIFWLAGDSLVTLGIGLFLGAAISVPVAWFLYRLRETEIAHAAVAIAFATLFSALIGGGVFWGANWILNQSLNSAGRGDMFVHSPVGPTLDWRTSASQTQTALLPPVRPTTVAVRPSDTTTRPAPVTPAEPVTPPTQPRIIAPVEESPRTPTETRPPVPSATETTGTAAAPANPPEQDPVADHPIFSRGRFLPIEQTLTDITFPVAPSDYFAGVSPSADVETQNVWLYSLNPFAPQDRNPFGSTVVDSGYALSADGRLLARVTHFGDGSAIQVYDFTQKRTIVNHPLGGIGNEPRLVGFLDNRALPLPARRDDGKEKEREERTLLCEWRNAPQDAAYVLGAFDLSTMQITLYAVSDERHSDVLAVMPDMKSIAVVGASNDGSVSLRFWQPKQKEDRTNLASRIWLMQYTGAFTVSPTGIAPRPDGKQVAIVYEAQGGQLQLLVCNVNDRRGPVHNHIFPGIPGLRAVPRAGKFPANRLTWLPGGDIVVYGNICLNVVTGQVVGTMNVGPIVAQKLVNDRTMEFVISGPRGLRILQTTIRDAATAPAR